MSLAEQIDLEEAITASLLEIRQHELVTAVDLAMEAIRDERLKHASSNGGPPLETERDVQRRVLNTALKDYGWRVSAIPARRGVGYDRI